MCGVRESRPFHKPTSFKAPMPTENKPATPFQITLLTLGAIAFFMCLLLGIVQRELLLVLVGAFWGLLMIMLALVVGIELYKSVRTGNKFQPKWLNVALFPVAALMVSLPVAGALATFSAGTTMLYGWARAPQTSELLVLWLCVPATMLVGGAAFFVRLRLRCFYGISEVGVGLFVAWFQVRGGGSGSLLSGTFLLAFITAAVYLVVRGLDNVHQGWKAEPPDPFAAFMKTRLASRLQKEAS